MAEDVLRHEAGDRFEVYSAGTDHGYQEFLEAVFDPAHEEFEHYRTWAGDPIHAEQFDLKDVNDTLERMRSPRRHRR
jgi:protein-tyrosine-phosphatase